jgi:carbon monoxide dehydrogenase subunit G
MNIEGTYTFQAPIEQVWKTLLDPEVLARTLPGIENMKTTGPDSYEATMHVGVAAVQGTYSGKVAILDKEEPMHYRLQAEGSGTRGFVKAEGTVDLAQQNGTTIATYKGAAQLGGPIAGVGMRVLPGVAKMMINQFFGTIAEELRAQQQPAPAAQSARAAATATTRAAPRAAKAPAATASAASGPQIAAQPVIARPTIEMPTQLIQIVRVLKLSDGSEEDEHRWAQRLLLGGIGLLLGVFLLGFLFGKGSRSGR